MLIDVNTHTPLLCLSHAHSIILNVHVLANYTGTEIACSFYSVPLLLRLSSSYEYIFCEEIIIVKIHSMHIK